MKRINLVRVVTSVALASALLVGASTHAATQIVENGILVGAKGVNVNGVYYDVRFEIGLCPGPSCQITFSNSRDALDASTALLEQVIIDTPLGSFGSNPLSIKGDNQSPLLTPYAIDGKHPWYYTGSGPVYYWEYRTYAAALFTPENAAYSTDLISYVTAQDAFLLGCLPAYSEQCQRTLTQWTVTTVPLPVAALLLAPTLLGLGFMRRRTL